MEYSAHSFRLDVRPLDYRPPFLRLGPVKGVKRLRRLLVTGEYLLANVGQSLTHGRVGKRVYDCGIESFGVPLGTHSPCQNEMLTPGTPSSSLVGMSGAANQRVLANTA